MPRAAGTAGVTFLFDAGDADAVETHVYLKTGEDDAFARTLLDMAEQTCFLHAFCRTALATRFKVSRGNS